MEQKQRNMGYDVMRILSIFMVVAIHSNVAYLGANQGKPGWLAVMSGTALCLVSVPLFFMLSGALLLDRQDVMSVKELYRKRLPKQAIPFAAWSLIYVLARIAMGKLPLSVGSFLKLLHEPAYYQFWFMYTLLGIYLLLPILQTLIRHLTKRQLEYLLGIWVVFSVVIPTASWIIPGFAISDHVDIVLSEGYIGYFLLGFYLKKHHTAMKPGKSAVLAVAGIAVILASALGEWLLTADAYQGRFYQAYLTPGVVIAVIGVFTLLQNRDFQKALRLRSAVEFLAKHTMGIYYIHMLVLTALEYLGLTGADNVLLLAAKVLLTCALSLAASVCISRVPIVNKLLHRA